MKAFNKDALITQLVEYDTFNVGVLGSSPSGRTKEIGERFLERITQFA